MTSAAACPRGWVFCKLEKFTDEQLKPPLRAWNRWNEWRLANYPAVSAFCPDAVTFFGFIEHVAGGGPKLRLDPSGTSCNS